MLAIAQNVFVAHAFGLAFHATATRRSGGLRPAREGYQEEPLTTIHDRNGRPTFDVFRFRKLHL